MKHSISVESETIFYYVNPDDSTEDDERHIGTSDPIQMDDTGSWSYILYAKDFEKGISESLDRPVLEFLFNKVESYSKDIPMTKKEEDITRGSIISFGKWYNETEEDMEPIQWIVLDVEDDKALLISRYGIDRQKYNVEDKPITWKECSLREWLNNDFLMNAFNKDEQDAIVVSHVAAERNPEYPKVDPGKDTDDKVFLLSLQEAAMYFPSDEARECIPTPYAIANGAYVSDTYKTCWWWLRSPGDDSDNAARVYAGGSLLFGGGWVSNGLDAVRPSLRIHL